MYLQKKQWFSIILLSMLSITSCAIQPTIVHKCTKEQSEIVKMETLLCVNKQDTTGIADAEILNNILEQRTILCKAKTITNTCDEIQY